MITVAWPILLLLTPLPWLFRYFLPPSDEGGARLRAPFIERAIRLQGLTEKQHSSRYKKLFVIIWLFLIVAAMRPQWLEPQQHLAISGRDLILAVDISASMNFPDLDYDNRISRLDLIKSIAGEFIDQRQGDRLGLVLFASTAYRQTPLTYDHQAVRHLLEEAEIGFLGRETAIGDAIGLVVSQLVENDSQINFNVSSQPAGHESFDAATRKILILMSDGANNSGLLDPRESAEMAARIGLKIYTVGLGANKMTSRTVQGIVDIDPSRGLDEVLLQDIAAMTGGHYIRAKSREDLIQFYKQLNRIEPGIYSQEGIRPATVLFYWPLAIAFLLSLYCAFVYLVKNYNRAENIHAVTNRNSND